MVLGRVRVRDQDRGQAARGDLRDVARARPGHREVGDASARSIRSRNANTRTRSDMGPMQPLRRHRGARGRSAPTAAGRPGLGSPTPASIWATAWFTCRAPRLPPKINTVRRSGARSSAVRASAARSSRLARTRVIWRRTGLPVTSTRSRAGKEARERSNESPTVASEAGQEPIRQTGDGVLLVEHDRHPRARRAASTVGTLTYPPTPTTTSAPLEEPARPPDRSQGHDGGAFIVARDSCRFMGSRPPRGTGTQPPAP